MESTRYFNQVLTCLLVTRMDGMDGMSLNYGG